MTGSLELISHSSVIEETVTAELSCWFINSTNW